jgi:hypothetical protein
MNAILVLPISGFGNEAIFAAYKQQYELFTGIKGVQNQIKRHGQSGQPNYKKISYPKAMQTNAC